MLMIRRFCDNEEGKGFKLQMKIKKNEEDFVRILKEMDEQDCLEKGKCRQSKKNKIRSMDDND